MKCIENKNSYKINFIESSPAENPIYTFQGIQIEKYINSFFLKHNLIVHDAQITFMKDNTLYVFISYYIPLSITQSIKRSQRFVTRLRFLISIKKKFFYRKKYRKYNFKKTKKLTALAVDKKYKKKVRAKIKKILKTEKTRKHSNFEDRLSVKRKIRSQRILSLINMIKKKRGKKVLFNLTSIKNKKLKIAIMKKLMNKSKFIDAKIAKKRKFLTRLKKVSKKSVSSSRVQKRNKLIYKKKIFNREISELQKAPRTKIPITSLPFHSLDRRGLLKLEKIRKPDKLRIYKNLNTKKMYKTKQVKKSFSFINKFLMAISLFLKNKYKIKLFLKVINKRFLIQFKNKKSTIPILFKILRKYSRTDFFKEALQVMIVSFRKQNSAKLLTHFIAYQFKRLKRHNFFFVFLKNTLKTILEFSEFSSIYKGIRIEIKGRFNGAPRARKRKIMCGSVPLNTTFLPLNYHEATSFTKNGTFGIKLWIC